MLTLSACMFTSCGDDEEDEPFGGGGSSEYISFGGSLSQFPMTGGNQTLIVTSGGPIVSWNSTQDWAWATLNGSSVTVSTGINTTGRSRNASITFSNSSGDEYVMSVFQRGDSQSDPGGNNPGGGDNPGGDNPGGGNNPGGSNSAPAAPQNLRVTEIGSAALPNCILRWDDSQGATKYIIYRSTSSSGSFSQIGTSEYSSYSDQTIRVGNVYYYKVKASNSYGTSDFSNVAECNFKDSRKPGPANIRSARASGGKIYVSWSIPTDASYGEPTSGRLLVLEPSSGETCEIETFSARTTSTSFAYGMWVNSYDTVKFGIELINDYGSSIKEIWYNTSTDQFIY